MNALTIICLAGILLASRATHGYNLKATQWLSTAQLEQTPSLDEITLQMLEGMPVETGAELLERIYHLSQIHHDLRPNYTPSASKIPSYIIMANGKKISTYLDNLASTFMQQPNFGDREVTIFITGLPTTSEAVMKANRNLIEAYLQRYNYKRQYPQRIDYTGEKFDHTSSEEDSSDWENLQPTAAGSFLVIDLGSLLNTFQRFAMLDVDHSGALIASTILEITEKSGVTAESIHVVAQGIAAHVAGAAANEYSRHTGLKLRRITALDPSKIMAKRRNTLIGLSRGDAEFVDAIHTSVYGMGTNRRVGDVDFYPNGPSTGVPGAENVVEASMRATRYFAETVRPGNEHNFPAVAAKSLKEYRENNGYGKRIYMGIDTDYDMEGDYILEVNPKSPFGKRTPARVQNYHHGMHNIFGKAHDHH